MMLYRFICFYKIEIVSKIFLLQGMKFIDNKVLATLFDKKIGMIIIL